MSHWNPTKSPTKTPPGVYISISMSWVVSSSFYYNFDTGNMSDFCILLEGVFSDYVVANLDVSLSPLVVMRFAHHTHAALA